MPLIDEDVWNLKNDSKKCRIRTLKQCSPETTQIHTRIFVISLAIMTSLYVYNNSINWEKPVISGGNQLYNITLQDTVIPTLCN